ncbi:MAG: nitrogenase molybdenum-iron protein subunit beta [Rhodospirillales bacterium]|nr:nitrogenase molybdenum-iron protein subunit beta [Rhodospirillales bacterium]
MPQNAEQIKDHVALFKEPEYQEMFARKREEFECRPSEEKVQEVAEWMKGWEYREKNLARESLTVNPARACQPLGAVFCAAGFEKSLSFVHGSQGCAAYFRSHLSRHFKEPSSAVSSNMTEDAAVFGGLNNMVEGLKNSYTLYKPEIIAVSTTCIAEVIGDDLQAFVAKAKQQGSVPEDFDVAYAHTPSFVGSHVDGYDNMLEGILKNFWEGKSRTTPTEKINIIPGFDGYCVGNIRELKRILALMGVEATILCDPSDVYDMPVNGEFTMYAGGTTIAECKDAINAKATVSLQEYCSKKSLALCKANEQEVVNFHYPLGIAGTDEFLMKISELTGKPIPKQLELERGRLIDALTDSMAYVHGKTFSLFGDPDFCMGMTRFLLEMGAEPMHIVCSNGTKPWAKKMKAIVDASPYGKRAQIWPGKDLWAMRSLLHTEPSEFLIGNSYGKYLERDCGIPLIRLNFPIFDRHHHHRFPQFGYEGAIRVLVQILDKVFDVMDSETNIAGKTDVSFDLTR